MLEQIRAALTEIAAQHADTRTQFFRVTADSLDAGRYALSGAVLDEPTLAQVLGDLGARFPDVAFDAAGVRVLRSAQPTMRTVAVNLTGFYAGPSFDTELVSQLLNGWTLELLDEEGRFCFLRQPDGYLGWAFRRYLDAAAPPAPTHIVSAPITLLMAQPEIGAPIVTRVPGGTAVAPSRASAHGASCRSPVGGRATRPLPACVRSTPSPPTPTRAAPR